MYLDNKSKLNIIYLLLLATGFRTAFNRELPGQPFHASCATVFNVSSCDEFGCDVPPTGHAEVQIGFTTLNQVRDVALELKYYKDFSLNETLTDFKEPQTRLCLTIDCPLEPNQEHMFTFYIDRNSIHHSEGIITVFMKLLEYGQSFDCAFLWHRITHHRL